MRLNPFSSKRPGRGRAAASSTGWLKSSTKRAIIGIVLLVIALISILSFFEAAGPTGEFLYGFLRRTFGLVAYIIPFALLFYGYYLLRPSYEPLEKLRIVGIGLTTVGVLGIVHLIGISAEDAYQAALDGRGGGMLGFMVSFPLSKATSHIAASILFIASFLTGAFLTFNLSFTEVMSWLSMFVPVKRTDEEENEDDEYEQPAEDESGAVPTFPIKSFNTRPVKPDPKQLKLQEEREQREKEQKEQLQQQLKAANKKYKPPSIDLLHSSIGKPNGGDVKATSQKIKQTLKQFGIEVAMGNYNIGPTVTQYTLRPETGTKLSRITALQNDLALNLAAHPIRIEAPIPNTDLVGIELPNKDVSLVRLRDLIASKAYKKAESPLTIALGKDVSGTTVVDTIEKMPHMLVAGATGSGKSIFINTLLLSLLYRNSPAVLRLILVDPKRVELSSYNSVPHLLTPVIVEPEKTMNALRWAVKEMDRRYRVLSETGARNLMSYNTKFPEKALPMIVIVIDELADLMVKHARDVEGAIVRLSQMARAIGIHLVLATQRPSVNVITGLIKANIPTRIAFHVASQIDSRTILDGSGAEKLLGSGDMLYLSGDRSKPVRLQASFVSEEEVRQVVEDISENNELVAEHDDTIVTAARGEAGTGGGEEMEDDLFDEAQRVVVELNKASASLLQRRLRVGYARAARLLDMLEENGIIGPAEGNKPREILAPPNEGYGQEDDLSPEEDSEPQSNSSSEKQW